jgi:hypothetical protein
MGSRSEPSGLSESLIAARNPIVNRWGGAGRPLNWPSVGAR